MNKLMVVVAYCVTMGFLCGEENLVSNVYERVNLIYGSDKWDSPRDVFDAVRGGDGFESGSVRNSFYELIPVVSNNCSKILQDWDAYATNEVVAFTVANAAAYSGGNVMLPLAQKAMARYEETKAEIDWLTIKYLMIPSLTPQMHFMPLNYDSPTVNSLVVRFRACLKARGDKPGLENWCDEVLSGGAKKHYLELKAAGAINGKESVR